MAEKIKIGGELDPRTPEKILGDASTIKDRTWAENHPSVAQTPNQKQDEINEYFQDQIDNIVATEQGGIQTDAAPTEGSVKLVQSGGTYASIESAKTFSTGEKVPNVGIDGTPTANSDNLVKSGGVYEAVSQLGQYVNDRLVDSLSKSEITTIARTLSGAKLVMDASNFIRASQNTDVVCFNVGANTNFEVDGVCSTQQVVCGIVANVAPVEAPWTKLKIANGQFKYVGKTTADEPIVAITIDKNSTFHCYKYTNYDSQIASLRSGLDSANSQIAQKQTDINNINNIIYLQNEITTIARTFSGYYLSIDENNFIKTSTTTDVVCFNVGVNKKFKVVGTCSLTTDLCGIIANITPVTAPWLSIKTGTGNFEIVGETDVTKPYVCLTVDKNSTFHCYTVETVKDKVTEIDEKIDNINIRQTVNILTTDSQVEILTKMLLAYNSGDCDVVFEHGVYTFDDVYLYMRDTLGWSWTMELPIGNNCRYYFNNSTLISNVPSETFIDSRNILGCKAGTSGKMSYELYDGILINNGGTYCVHDECARGNAPYIHKYKNIRMEYNAGTATENLSKCIGGGCGIDGEIVIEDCIFINNNTSGSEDVSYHGLTGSETPISMNFFVSNSWFNHSFGVRSDLKATDDIVVKYSNCSQGRNDTVDTTYCTLYKFNIETRS